MQTMIPTVLRNEVDKLVRRKILYLGIAAVLLTCIFVYCFTRGAGERREMNGWEFVGLVMQTGFADAGELFIIIFGAMLIAQETGGRTTRLVLTAPVKRWEFFVGKALVGLLYVLILSVTALAGSVLLGAFRYSFSDVSDSMGVIYTRKEILANLAKTVVLSWPPLAAAVFYGLFISTIVKGAGQAIAAAIGSLVLIETGKHFLGGAQYVFTSHITAPWVVFHEVAQGVDYTWSGQVWNIVVVSAAYSVVCLIGGLLVFEKRDLND